MPVFPVIKILTMYHRTMDIHQTAELPGMAELMEIGNKDGIAKTMEMTGMGEIMVMVGELGMGINGGTVETMEMA